MSDETHSPKALATSFRLEVGGRRNRFSLEVELELDAGVLVLFGPSGSGKSLTLQVLVGVLKPAEGWLEICGHKLFDIADKLWTPAHRRKIGYVPQHHSLFPFCSVRDNIAFGLPYSERRGTGEIVDELISELGLGRLAESMPANLSGGERQRVALARALAVRPRLLVLDEPFASIDMDGREQLRTILLRTLERHKTPAVFVTHDPQEARKVADRVVRYERGRTTIAGPPSELLAPAPR